MAGSSGQGAYRLYSDLADWWPLISPPSQYAAEAARLAQVLGSAAIPVREVLDLGSGGGHIAAHLKDTLALTLVDLSAGMLAVSRRLNPGCAHVQGDMRTIRLGRSFDAVLVHDAVDYMVTESDLRKVIETAFAHCRPGGIAVFVPDYTRETFRPAEGTGGGEAGPEGPDGPDGRRASFSERLWDPDPADTWVQADYEFVLRSADGTVQVVREAHRLGAFGRRTWLALLAGAGFEPDPRQTTTGRDGRPRHVFAAHRPAVPAAEPAEPAARPVTEPAEIAARPVTEPARPPRRGPAAR